MKDEKRGKTRRADLDFILHLSSLILRALAFDDIG
jgi:hypothetical protein